MNREKLVKENIIKDYKKITNKFYIIMQYMWYRQSNLNEQKGEFIDLIYEIESLSGINKIYNKLDSLIEFLLLAIHSEQTLNNKETKINYKMNELQKDFYGKDSFIRDLILSKTIYYCDKCKNKKYSLNYILYFNINELIQNKIIKNNVNINDLLSIKQETFCEKCENIIYVNKTFVSLPKLLIIIIQNGENNKFNLIEKINIKNKDNKKIEYELINLIKKQKKTEKEYEIINLIKESNEDKNDIKETEEKESEENKNVITYLKSPINNLWYKYEEKEEVIEVNFDDIKNDNFIPNLLIYKEIDKTIIKNR